MTFLRISASPDPPVSLQVAAARAAAYPAPVRPFAVLLLLAAGCSEKPPAPLPTFDFVAYGDCRHNEKVHRDIAGGIARTNPRFILVTGDLVDEPDKEEDWRSWREITKDLRATSEYLCCVGDHDWEKVDTFLKELKMERWYADRRIGDVHVFLLDSRQMFKDKEQVEWLEKTAAASNARHKFAVFHHPPFMIDHKRGYEADNIRPQIHPLLVKLKFCAAFCGHHHAFYATARDGVRYVVTGGGGASLYPIDEKLAQKGDVHRRFHHFVGCTMEEKKIAARVFDEAGREAEDLAFTLCEHP